MCDLEFQRDLEEIAPLLNSTRQSEAGDYQYDAMTESIVWDDERPPVQSMIDVGRTMRVLRRLLRYRASVALGEPEVALEPAWNLAKSLCPSWVGFAEERVHPSNEVVEFLRARVAATRAATKRLIANRERHSRS